jgi:hypothetical protein
MTGLVVAAANCGLTQPLNLTVPTQGHRSIVEAPGACGGPPG